MFLIRLLCYGHVTRKMGQKAARRQRLMPRVKSRKKKLAKAAWQRSRESRASSQGECLRARAPL